MPRVSTTDPSILEAALEGLELQRRRLDEQIDAIRAALGRSRGRTRGGAAAVGAPRKRRELSPEARRRIAAAQKKRWAEFRKRRAAGEA